MNQQSLSKINDGLPEVIQDLEIASKYLLDNNLVPAGIKPSDVRLILARGMALNMDAITAISSIDIIGGKPSLQAKVIPALLSQHNVYLEVLKDYDPIYETKTFPKKDKETGEVLEDENGNTIYYTNPDGSILTKEIEIDRITEVKFIRFLPNGEKIENTCKFLFSWAKLAGWVTKDEVSWN
jgi:hypothetical protein